MITKRPTKKLGVLFHEHRLFIVQKTHYGPNGRPRTTSDKRYRVFEIAEGGEGGSFLATTWIGSVPTMKAVKGLIETHVNGKKES